ncbi:hypothetical protein ES332_A01G084000v1 [Gossypium tomentosum]|uniref:Receptor-like serine/threonine-protein kinase n=1 Tax=Gossypium tomentosum TaxID=34277 RepID=A0A5D2RN04_GOSTO|nr:hypothetical protein ES332_A01G084000v1 [Gossypium tomentosum]
MIPKTQFVYPVLLLMFSSHILKYSNAVVDTISPGQQLNISQTIVSAGKMFELGFFSPTNSTNYYMGIWYKNIPGKTVVWIANRDYPVTGSAVLSISVDGNLVIRHGRIVYMVTDIVTNGNVTATLLDSGNLVVRDEKSNTLWQSFDFPCNTFLPGMRLGYDNRNGKSWSYISWKSDDDPSPGNYTLKLDSEQGNRILILNGDDEYWRSKLWEEDSNVFESPPEVRLNMFNFSFVSNLSMTYLTYNLYREDLISRLMIDSNGRLRQFSWSGNEWDVLNSQPRNACDVLAYCGGNSSCTEVPSPNCSCLPGFKPNSPELWNKADYKFGCSMISGLQCGNDTNIKGAEDRFRMLSKVVLPKNPLPLQVQTLSDCRSSCLNDCSCAGFSYISQSCSIWIGELRNLQQLSADDISGTDFFLKLPAAELGTGKRTPSKRKQLIIIISVTISASILASALFIWKVKMKMHKRTGEDLLSFDLSISPEPTKNEQSGVKQLQKHKKEVEIPIFSFSSVSAATNNFSLSNKLGEGGFGPVYKGKLLKGNEVAVKRLSRKSGQGWNELKNEAVLIAKLQHKNLVKLLGCCIEGDEKILVYEYLPNKSLDLFLFGTNNIFTLAWGTRIRIVDGIAQGLLYLHQFSRLQIIHRDLKASNILLDEDMNPKISDFGMARSFGGTEPQATDKIVGTYGYMAPEYALEGVFSVKSDVFSFGVLLLKILSGMKNTGFYQSSSLNLLGYAWDLWISSRPLELMDIVMKDSSCANAAIRYINIALLCVQEHAADRPTMSEVVLMLSNELTSLPSPKKPAFSNVRSMVDSIPNPSHWKPETCSENELTISDMDAR